MAPTHDKKRTPSKKPDKRSVKNQRSSSKSGSSSGPRHSDSSILPTSSTPQQTTSSQAHDEHDETASDNADILLAPSQDCQVLYATPIDAHHYNNQDNITTSLLHIPVGYGIGSASQTESYALHRTDNSQYFPTGTASTWGANNQNFTWSDTPIQYDTSSNYQDTQVQLQQWAYQTSNSHLTVAERLEKGNWETKRHERL